jgi:peptidoglycan/LPS O-acetylase OafA/YrhL
MLKVLFAPGAFRYFLALVVFAHHLSRVALGTAAVYVFLALSGYWIYRMWVDKYAMTVQPYFTYCVSRAWRILPVFWLCGVVTFVLNRTTSLGSGLHYWFSQLLIFGYNSLPYRPDVPAWSLDIEMQFYVIAPLLAALLLRVPAGVLIVLASMFSAIASHIWGQSLASCLVFFVLGMASARSNWRPKRHIVAVSLACVVLIIVIALLVPNWRSLVLVGAHAGALAWLNPCLQVAIGLLIIPYAIWTTHQSSNSRDKVLADASYALYLLHWPLFQWMERHWLARSLLPVAVLVASTIALSLGIVVYFDAPIQRARNRWLKGRRAPPVQGGVLISS